MPPDSPTAVELLRRALDGTHPLVVIETDDEIELRERLFVAVPEDVAYRRWSAVVGLGEARYAGNDVADTDHPAAARSRGFRFGRRRRVR